MLRVERLNVGYGDMQVLWDVSLSVTDGATVALVGANGAGKTTLLNTISGLLSAWSGKIYFDGVDITNLSPSSRVKLGIVQVPEGRKLFAGMTVEENLEMGAFLRRDSKQIKRDLNWVYELFPEIAPRRAQLAGTLSGGEQQMVAIGRALMASPKLLLIDEFSLGLAPVVVERLANAMKQIKAETQLSILLVEQDVHLGFEMSDNGFVLETGRVVMAGSSKELLENDAVKEAYLGL